MAATLASHLDWSSMISAPHIAAIALPVMALISHSRSSSASSTPSITPSGSPPAAHASLWPDDSPVNGQPASPSPNALGLTTTGLTSLVNKAVRGWRLHISAQVEVLSEVADQQAEDDGDEADWYAHERSSVTRSRSTSRTRSGTNRSLASTRTRTRARSCSKSTLSAEELNKRLVSLEARAPREFHLASPPPSRRRRAAC